MLSHKVSEIVANCILATTLILVGVFYVGCDQSPNGQAPKPSYDQKNAQSITYVRDDRTGLCFAVSTVNEYPLGAATIYSHVPCRDSVEKLIK